jgi:hypothetical protein
VRAEQKCVPLDKMVYRLLQAAMAERMTLGALLNRFEPPLRSRLLAYFRDLGRHGLLEFNPPRGARDGAAEVLLATASVVPEPHMGSSTAPPGNVAARMIRPSKVSGF